MAPKKSKFQAAADKLAKHQVDQATSLTPKAEALMRILSKPTSEAPLDELTDLFGRTPLNNLSSPLSMPGPSTKELIARLPEMMSEEDQLAADKRAWAVRMEGYRRQYRSRASRRSEEAPDQLQASSLPPVSTPEE